jgi:hypothetical protein
VTIAQVTVIAIILSAREERLYIQVPSFGFRKKAKAPSPASEERQCL